MGTLKKTETLQKCWIWNNTITEFVKSRVSGYSLNVCAGKNPICDINMDLDPQDRAVIKGDMRCLPFKSNIFDTVVSDPPWKISYYERFRPFFECVRVCKVGGTIIYNATWIPSSTDVELVEVYARQDNVFSTTSLISIFRKLKDNPDYEYKVEKELLESGMLPLMGLDKPEA